MMALNVVDPPGETHKWKWVGRGCWGGGVGGGVEKGHIIVGTKVMNARRRNGKRAGVEVGVRGGALSNRLLSVVSLASIFKQEPL